MAVEINKAAVSEVSGFKLTRPPEPENGLRILVTVADGNTIIDFGQAIQWFILVPDQLDNFIKDLQQAARQARALWTPPAAAEED